MKKIIDLTDSKKYSYNLHNSCLKSYYLHNSYYGHNSYYLRNPYYLHNSYCLGISNRKVDF